MTQISVTRALVELKRFDERIQQATQQVFVSRTVGHKAQQKVFGSAKSVDVVKSEIKGAFDKIESLMKNRQKLKAAIVLSNANTTVSIMNQTMTVAEAIELKQQVSLRESYLYALRAQLQNNRALIDKANADLQNKIDTSLNNIYGSEKSKIGPDVVASVAEPQKDAHEQNLLDPCDIENKILTLDSEVKAIKSELDFVLSESNARNLVEVTLD